VSDWGDEPLVHAQSAEHSDWGNDPIIHADEPRATAWGPSSAWKRPDAPSEPQKRPWYDLGDVPYAGAIQNALAGEFRGAITNPAVGIAQTVAHTPAAFMSIVPGGDVIKEIVSRTIGEGPQADKFVQQRDAKIQAERAARGETGTDWWQAAGSAMSPVNYMIPGGTGANALARIGLAARTGATAAATQPVTSGDNFGVEKAKQAGIGAFAGTVVGTAGEAIGAIARPVIASVRSGIDGLKRWLGAEMPSSLQSTAVHKVLEQFGKDEAAGGPKLTEVMDVLNTARATGKPMTLADAGGTNVNALAGYVTRQPGEASSTARTLLAERDKAAATRLSKDITAHVTSGPTMKQTADALTQARAAAARPLYEEAMKPGSTAPLESQFNAEFGRIQAERSAAQRELAAAERQTTATAAKQSQAGNVGDLSVRGTDARAADQGTVQAAKAKLAQLDAQEAKTTEALRESQRAATAGDRGGVWSPRIAQFLQDPIVKHGIRQGLEIQRIEALAQGKPFNPADYGVTGTAADGEIIVAKVPNMRLLDSAKRGLDEILDKYRDPTSGRVVLDQRGRAIVQLKQSLVDELDRLNPSYKAARAAYSGPSQSIDAMKAGADIFNHSPEEVAERFSRLSPNDKEFYRLGVADKLRERIAKTGIGGDEAKAIIKNNWTKSQLQPIFETQEQFDHFIDAATMESKMFDTAFRLKGGSHTAERLAADHAFGADVEAAGHGVSAAKNVARMNWLPAVSDMWRMKQALGWRKNQALNAEIAKLLFDPAMTQDALQASAGTRLLQNFPGPQTQNYLAQMTRQRLQQLAPAAGMIAPSLLDPGPSQ
jgi:hypothetical protein